MIEKRLLFYIFLLIWFIMLPGKSFPKVLIHKYRKSHKPNIIFILCDDMGWRDLGTYGSTFYETPNIDKLASQGMKFMDAYASSPECSPSRAGIMTGQYPSRVGITDWIVGDRYYFGPQPNRKLISRPYELNLPKSEITIAQTLKDHGYVTCFAGKWHLGLKPSSWPRAEGFDYNYGGWAAGDPRAYGMGGYFSPWNNPKLKNGPKGTFLTDRLTTLTINFIKKEVQTGRPFFADLSYYAVHIPIQAKKKYITMFREKAHRLQLDTFQQFVRNAPWMKGSFKERIVQDNPVYAGLIYSVDQNVGRIMRTLRQLGIAKNTIVVFTADNGGLATAQGSPTSNLPLMDGKGWTYEGGIRVPLIIKWPGVAKPGSVSNFPVINTDFYPTFLQMAGLPQMPKQSVDGVSMVPLLKGKSTIDQPVLYWHYPHYSDQGGTPSSAIRMGNWKLIQFYGDNHVELYNLRTDIEEQSDLTNAMPEKTAELLHILNEWKQKVHAKIPLINPYYNPHFGAVIKEKHETYHDFMMHYDSLFSKQTFNFNSFKKVRKRMRALSELTKSRK